MAVPAILHDLIRAGVEFETDGERIRWRNSSGRITPEVIDQLRTRKGEIISFLTGKTIQSGHEKAPVNRGNIIPWTGRRYTQEAIRQGVAEAFADYAATDNPHDPRAWQ